MSRSGVCSSLILSCFERNRQQIYTINGCIRGNFVSTGKVNQSMHFLLLSMTSGTEDTVQEAHGTYGIWDISESSGGRPTVQEHLSLSCRFPYKHISVSITYQSLITKLVGDIYRPKFCSQ